MHDGKDNSRREFLRRSSTGGLGAVLGVNSMPSLFSKSENVSAKRNLSIRPRYYRWHVDPGVQWLETNTDYATLDWDIPFSKTALVLVDVWQRHYLLDTEARGESIINKSLIPLMSACRKADLQIIHAPSPSVAMQHPNWVKLVDKAEMHTQHDSWPPPDFRSKSGNYVPYRRPVEPREAERQSLPPLSFHPDAGPQGKEPVVATGEELHRYCKLNGILFLVYAGFNTNACILSRDYGTLQMSNRGYEVILVRDCTTGMESRNTQASLSQTTGAVLLLEMFGQYSITSDEVIDAIT
ncbi:MAG: isochorismatase family protein [Saprospiraceae bacterium]|nr:isochorismatase family protein [Saprospiraceae bacterium]